MFVRNLETTGRVGRRAWLAETLAASLGVSLSGWMRPLAARAGSGERPKRSCILLWMAGGPSQTDTFDLKPNHPNGGPFKPISTAVAGLPVGEHLPHLASWTDTLSVVRSMSTKEGDHGRATRHLRTGYLPQGSLQFPPLGSLVSSEHAGRDADLPNYVSILSAGLFPAGVRPAGFLGADHAPLLVGGGGGEDGRLEVENLSRDGRVTAEQAADRLDLLRSRDAEFLSSRPGAAADSYRAAYGQAVRLMSSSAAKAFDLDEEPAMVRDAYGRGRFGQGCLLARRLVERGVPFVEVTLGGWDTHDDNFSAVKNLCGTLDPAWSSLLRDLKERGLLESTLVVWMGEFGRTPVINPRQGRDHYPKAWTVVLGGGGIRGGGQVGRTSDDGLTVEDRPVAVPDLVSTICLALGLDPAKQNMSDVGRPIRLADPEAEPIREILA